MSKQNLLITLAVALALAVVAAGPVEAKERAVGEEKTENCSLKGTWYGFNNHGNTLVGTVTRTGKGVYSVVFDTGASFIEGTTGATNWRGDIVKIGAKKYQLTTMAFFPFQEGLGIPLGMGLCSVTLKKEGCTFKGVQGSCDFYGFFEGQDPFTEGIPLGEPSRLKSTFRRMPSIGAGE